MATLDDEAPPITNLQADSELANQIQDDIRKKLQAEYADAGTEETVSTVLPEYIKVLVCNSKPKSKVVKDLHLFLQERSEKFVDWLWGLLADRNPQRTHSAFDTSKMDEDKPAARAKPKKKKADGDKKKQDKKRSRSKVQVDHYPSGKGLRDALQSAVDDAMQVGAAGEPVKPRRSREDRKKIDGAEEIAQRRRLRVRGTDPERTAKLRDEWEEMRRREERAAKEEDEDAGMPVDGAERKSRRGLDRDLLSPETVSATDTKFTITMDKVKPEDIPSIAHYTDDEAAAGPAGLLALGKGGQLPQALSGLLGLTSLAQLGKGGKGGKGAKGVDFYGGAGHVMPYTPRYGRGAGAKGQTAAGAIQYGRGGNLSLVKTSGPEGPAFKKRFASQGKGAGKGGFQNLVWEPGKSSEEDAKRQAALVASKTETAVSLKGNKVWVNPAIKAADAMKVDTPTMKPAEAPTAAPPAAP